MNAVRTIVVGTVLGALALPSETRAAEPSPSAVRAASALRSELRAESGADSRISWRRATGTARSLRLAVDPARRSSPPLDDAAVRALLARHGALFGLADAGAELRDLGARADRYGFRHLVFEQQRDGVPVFGARLVVHLDRAGALESIFATTIPLGAISTTPRVSEAAAREAAVRELDAHRTVGTAPIAAESSRLAIYALGLDRGDRFEPRLAWEIVAGDGGLTRERIFVDAGSGKPIDALPLVHDALARRAFSGRDQAPFDGVPDSWPDEPDWIEGDAFPTGVGERDAALAGTADAHALFLALGRDSYDGAGHELDVSWNRASLCPNAGWNGLLASFCAGFAVHDVVVHEWAHAYTQETHGLIYRWQSGALNESYSDLWGELADQAAELASGRDTDAPSNRRADESCSSFVPARLRIVSPHALAGDLAVGLAAFGLPATSMSPADLLAAEDGAGASGADGCEPLVNASDAAGAIVYVRRGACAFETQARHAQAAGAVGLVVGNDASSPAPDVAPALTCDPVEACDLSIAIPAVSLALAEATALESALAGGSVRGAIEAGANQGAADSVRWLLGEDVRPLGLARDMWKPSCLGAPDAATDERYHCAASDNGGVHVNSGVPNRAFALLVDGGRARGIDVRAIGRVAAAHLYWRAQSVYQLPYSDFSDHADALEAACADLAGLALEDPWGGPPRTLGVEECAAVGSAIAVVDLRATPPCPFEPILAKEPPPLCPAHELELVRAEFETGADGFVASRRDVLAPETFEQRDWTRTAELPDARAGAAFFAADPHAGSCVTDQGGDDETGVLVLESPEMGVPLGLAPRLAFDHLIATEEEWDGGNLKLSVDGGAWQLVPGEAFLYNAYTSPLRTEELGNSNPLAGEPAFHGLDEGSNSGSWGRSLVDLGTLVPPGARFRLRFELGTDVCVGTPLGWYLDDVRVAACVEAPPIFLDGFESGDAGRWGNWGQSSKSHKARREREDR